MSYAYAHAAAAAEAEWPEEGTVPPSNGGPPWPPSWPIGPPWPPGWESADVGVYQGETISFADEVSATVTMPAAVTEAMTFSDDLTNRQSFGVSVDERITLSAAGSSTMVQVEELTKYVDGSLNSNLRKTGVNIAGADAETVITEAHDDAVAATIVADDEDAAGYVLRYKLYDGQYYHAYVEGIRRLFVEMDVPAGVVAIAISAIGNVESPTYYWHNYYDYSANTTAYVGTYNAEIYLSTTTPGTLTAADWTFGTIAATLTLPAGYTGREGDAPSTDFVSLTGFTAGTMNYLQVQCEENAKIALVDLATWNAGYYFSYQWIGNLQVRYTF